jgi:hypothetical protein
MLSDSEMYDRMKNGWRMGKPFTVCGNGSTLEATANIRRWLPDICERYGIRSIVDAGAGDMVWIERIKWDVAYQPFDLIPRRDDVSKIDITTEVLPRADAILCRMVLNHLQERLEQTVDLLRLSGSTYLIATQFDSGVNRERQFQRLDLRPYFGDPIESVQDGMEEGCALSLFRLSA